MIEVAQQDAWLSYLPALGFAFLSLWMLSEIMSRFPERDLFAAMMNHLPFWGRVVSVWYVFFFFFIFARDIRILIDFTDIILLPQTPLIVIAILITLTATLITRGGIEVIARMTEFFFPILAFIVLILPIFVFSELDFKQLKPFLEQGVGRVLQGSWYSTPYVGEIIALPFIFSNRSFQLRNGIYGLLVGTFLLESLIIQTIMVFGPDLTIHLFDPPYELIRQIRITDFLDRFDLPIAAIWIPNILIKISLDLYIVVHGITRIFSDVSAKLITTSTGLLGMVCSFWFFENSIQQIKFDYVWPVLANIFVMGLPALLFFILRPPQKKEHNSQKRQN